MEIKRGHWTLHVESEDDVGDLEAGDERPKVGSGDDAGDLAARECR